MDALDRLKKKIGTARSRGPVRINFASDMALKQRHQENEMVTSN